MPEESEESPSVWDDADAFSSITSEQDIDWDAVIGQPAEWCFPLVGQVAVATAGLERQLARAALHVLGWQSERGGDLAFWLSSSARLRSLLAAAKGVLPGLDALAAQMEAVWRQRNEVVHVSTGWHDWEAPDEPSG